MNNDLNNTTPERTEAAVIAKRSISKGKKAVEKNFAHLERLVVEYVPMDSIVPNSYNPNRQSEHDFELLCKSMEEDGFDQPILVGRDNVIIDGEHRWRAAKVLRYNEIPIVRLNMDATQARISTIRHNRARGSHDLELEAEVLRDLDKLGALEIAQDSLMIDDEELNRLLKDIPAPEAMSSEEFSEAWVPGDFTEQEKDVLLHGGEQIKKELEGNKGMHASTAKAADIQRQREGLIVRAKSDQERRQILMDNKVYRVSMVFANDEAELVKQVLGDAPAEKLLQLCINEVENAA